MGGIAARTIDGAGLRRGARVRRAAAALGILLLLLMTGFAAAATGEERSMAELERAKNEDAALEMWPEAADPQSIMGREVQRLLDYYTRRKDPRLGQVAAPMWIASQAAANTERFRTQEESQQAAMRLYPDLAVLDSPLNRLFRETYERYKEVKPGYFADARWPIKLAQQCARQLAAQRAIGSFPRASADAAAAGDPPEEIADERPAPAEAPPRPMREWVLTGLLSTAGLVLLVLILRRALRMRRTAPGEQDGSSI